MRITPHAKVAWREVAGSLFLLHLDRRVLYGLDPAGTRLWCAIAEGCDVGDLTAQAGGVDLDDGGGEPARAAIARFTAQLAELGLVELSEPVPVENLPPSPSGFQPRVLWQESIEAVAASCAHFPGQSPICIQAPRG